MQFCDFKVVTIQAKCTLVCYIFNCKSMAIERGAQTFIMNPDYEFLTMAVHEQWNTCRSYKLRPEINDSAARYSCTKRIIAILKVQEFLVMRPQS